MAQKFAAKPAVDDGEQTFSYRDLNDAAIRLATELRQARGDREEPVVLLLEHGPAMLTAFLGAVKAGKIATPLDPTWPASRLTEMIDDSQGSLVVTNRNNEALARQLAGSSRVIIVLESLSVESLPAEPPQDFSGNRLAYLLYTSGSTGKPKGIVHSHRTALHNIGIYTTQLSVTADDRITWLHSPGFSSAWAEILTALMNGATICPWNIRARGLSGLGEWHNRQRVTIVNWAPSPFRRFMETLGESGRLHTPRLLVLGSEPVTRHDWELYSRHFPDPCRFVNRLGATEINNYRMCLLDKWTAPIDAVIPGGYAVPDKDLTIVDDSDRPVEPGTIGQIVIRSRHCSPGYWRNPELTERVFVPDPIDPAYRLYRTGDLGLLRPDGCLEFHGRADHQVKIRGVRVEIGEVENALTIHPDVREAAVVARSTSDGELRLIAFLVARRSRLGKRALRAHLQAGLPAAMIPSEFIYLDSLPTTDTGKVNRAALQVPPDQQQKSLSALPILDGADEAGWSPTETRLATIWCRLLKEDTATRNESFFDSGGDSLLALALFARVCEEFGRQFPLDALLETPTIAGIARLIEKTPDGGQRAIVSIQPDGDRPPLFVTPSFTGSLLFWKRFVPHLSREQPLLGLHPPEHHGVIQPFKGIEALAEYFASELHARYPVGDFRIAGYSFGGPLAYEVARQLHERGRSVPLLVVIDAEARRKSLTWSQRLKLLPGLAANAGYWLTDDLIPSGIRSVLRRWYKALRDLARGVRPQVADELREIELLPEHLRVVHRSAIRAMCEYSCRPFPATVTLIRNRLQRWSRLQPHDFRWGELVPRVDVQVVTFCRHYQMVREPHVEQVAVALQKALDAVERAH